MIWVVRAAAVAVFTLYGPVFADQGQSLPASFGQGFFVGLMLVGISMLFGKLGTKIRARFPEGARRTGKVFYWLGVGIAVICAIAGLLTAITTTPLAGAIVAGFGVMYWLAGWGVRRALMAA